MTYASAVFLLVFFASFAFVNFARHTSCLRLKFFGRRDDEVWLGHCGNLRQVCFCLVTGGKHLQPSKLSEFPHQEAKEIISGLVTVKIGKSTCSYLVTGGQHLQTSKLKLPTSKDQRKLTLLLGHPVSKMFLLIWGLMGV